MITMMMMTIMTMKAIIEDKRGVRLPLFHLGFMQVSLARPNSS